MILAFINIISFIIIILEVIIEADNISADAIYSYLYEAGSPFFAAGVYY